MSYNQDVERLKNLLAAAAGKLLLIQKPTLSVYSSTTGLADFLLQCEAAIKEGKLTVSQKQELRLIFAPTGDWDDIIGDAPLANEVFFLLEKFYGNEI